jgi:hypothetical protein
MAKPRGRSFTAAAHEADPEFCLEQQRNSKWQNTARHQGNFAARRLQGGLRPRAGQVSRDRVGADAVACGAAGGVAPLRKAEEQFSNSDV